MPKLVDAIHVLWLFLRGGGGNYFFIQEIENDFLKLAFLICNDNYDQLINKMLRSRQKIHECVCMGDFFTINSTRGIFKYVMMRLQEMIFVQIVLYIHFV